MPDCAREFEEILDHLEDRKQAAERAYRWWWEGAIDDLMEIREQTRD